jgi:hypothetical protein
LGSPAKEAELTIAAPSPIEGLTAHPLVHLWVGHQQGRTVRLRHRRHHRGRYRAPAKRSCSRAAARRVVIRPSCPAVHAGPAPHMPAARRRRQTPLPPATAVPRPPPGQRAHGGRTHAAPRPTRRHRISRRHAHTPSVGALYDGETTPTRQKAVKKPSKGRQRGGGSGSGPVGWRAQAVAPVRLWFDAPGANSLPAPQAGQEPVGR